MKSQLTRRDFLRLNGATAAATFLRTFRTLAAATSSTIAVLARSAAAQAIAQALNAPWARYHDPITIPVVPTAAKILYPTSLEDLIQLCSTRASTEHFKAAGSHWALSEAAISDTVFIETHDPNNHFPAMGRTLYDVVPRCLTRQLLDMLGSQSPKPFDESHADSNEGVYLVHVETGKRVYQLYSELDVGDDNNPDSLARQIARDYGNFAYLGPWAFQTLGGAGGQTVFGALTTGTHGGDFGPLQPGDERRFPPIADSVLALHLVADGGKHYWIEPESLPLGQRLTDDAALMERYGIDQYCGNQPPGQGRKNFEIIRDDTIFNAVLVSTGRFGIVYSLVLRAVRQYSLHQERRLSNWQAIKEQVKDIASPLYSARFLQIGICLTPHEHFQKNLCGITKRWNVPAAIDPATGEPVGRLERRGAVLEDFNPHIGGPLFERAGNSLPYDPDANTTARSPSFLELACANSDFMVGIIASVTKEIQTFIDDNTVAIGGTIAAVVVIGGTSGLVLVVAALTTIVATLLAFLGVLGSTVGPTMGATMNDLRNELLNRSARLCTKRTLTSE